MITSRSLFLNGLASTTRWGDTNRISISWAVNPDVDTLPTGVIHSQKRGGAVLGLDDAKPLTLK